MSNESKERYLIDRRSINGDIIKVGWPAYDRNGKPYMPRVYKNGSEIDMDQLRDEFPIIEQEVQRALSRLGVGFAESLPLAEDLEGVDDQNTPESGGSEDVNQLRADVESDRQLLHLTNQRLGQLSKLSGDHEHEIAMLKGAIGSIQARLNSNVDALKLDDAKSLASYNNKVKEIVLRVLSGCVDQINDVIPLDVPVLFKANPDSGSQLMRDLIKMNHEVNLDVNEDDDFNIRSAILFKTSRGFIDGHADFEAREVGLGHPTDLSDEDEEFNDDDDDVDAITVISEADYDTDQTAADLDELVEDARSACLLVSVSDALSESLSELREEVAHSSDTGQRRISVRSFLDELNEDGPIELPFGVTLTCNYEAREYLSASDRRGWMSYMVEVPVQHKRGDAFDKLFNDVQYIVADVTIDYPCGFYTDAVGSYQESVSFKIVWHLQKHYK